VERLQAPTASFLDVGSGVGALAIEMCSIWPHLHVVGLEPQAVPLAEGRRNVAAAGLGDRIALRAQRVEEMTEHEAFDLAWLPQVFLPREAFGPGLQRAAVPDDTLKAFEYYGLGLKGPLTTPIGGGFRSINVFLRIKFDLYACVRPVRYFKGVEAPNKRADKVNMVIFRENTEDVYCGIEFKSNSDRAKRVLALLKEMGYNVVPTSGIGIKPMSPEGTKRLVRMAIRYAIDKKLPSVTLMHKGTIMKFTAGAFKDWGYELARQEFARAEWLCDVINGSHF